MTLAHRRREVYPHIEERIGEDPARFLDRDLDTDSLRLIESRIRGIDYFEVLAAWGEVERKLVRTPDGSHTEAGRDRILELLEQRARELRTIGERDVRLENRREIVVDDDQDDEDVEPTVWRHDVDECGSTDVDRVSDMAFDCGGCGKRVSAAGDRVVEVDP